VRRLEDLIDTRQPAIELLREWVRDAEVPCDLLPPGLERDDVLLAVQVTTRSTLGALAYETGGLLVDGGWVRLLGSGHPRLPRPLPAWNAGRSNGYYLVGDDAAGGFFALNGGALGPRLESVYYWAPDALDWECLDLGFTDLVRAFLTTRVAAFYERLRWPGWADDVRTLAGDQCFAFYPYLWTEEGSPAGSRRAAVPVSEAFDLKVDIVRQLDAAGRRGS